MFLRRRNERDHLGGKLFRKILFAAPVLRSVQPHQITALHRRVAGVFTVGKGPLAGEVGEFIFIRGAVPGTEGLAVAALVAHKVDVYDLRTPNRCLLYTSRCV